MTDEKPILFTPAMVAAILRDESPKTVTRRIIKPQPSPAALHPMLGSWGVEWMQLGERTAAVRNPYACDILWVKETHWRWGYWEHVDGRWHFVGCDSFGGPQSRPVMFKKPDDYLVAKSRTEPDLCYHKRPSIFMPRRFARLFLRVKDVRVERVQDITQCDVRDEGIRVLPLQNPNDTSAWWESSPGQHQARTAFGSFQLLWDSINGKKPGCSWSDNPWCWVVEFERVQP